MGEIILKIGPEDDGRQVKHIIKGALMLSHRDFMRLKYAGEMRLDGDVVHANHIGRAGQCLALFFPDERPAAAYPDTGGICVVYEDDAFLVVDKPAPLPCQSSVKQSGVTLENRFAHYLPDRPFRPVNRLDKGTSGLMVCAKSARTQTLLSKQLHSDEFERDYIAIALGAPPEPEGVIDLPIGKAEGATIRREVRADGKPAATRYRVIETRGGMSLMELTLKTGRTHQIRVHLSHIHCPVLGDFLYGEESEALPGRFALHSRRVSLIHPFTGERLEFISPMPADFRGIFGGVPHIN